MVVVRRKSNTIRNFPCTVLQCPVVLTTVLQCPVVLTTVLQCPVVLTTVLQCPVVLTTVLQCPVVLTSLKSSLISTTVSALKVNFCSGVDALTKGDRLVGLVVKASASRTEDPRFESRLRRDFSGSSHTSDFNIGTPVAPLPGAWRCRVSAGTGRPGVSILWLDEVESLICNFYLSVAARTIVWLSEQIRPWYTLARCWDVKQPTNNNHKRGWRGGGGAGERENRVEKMEEEKGRVTFKVKFCSGVDALTKGWGGGGGGRRRKERGGRGGEGRGGEGEGWRNRSADVLALAGKGTVCIWGQVSSRHTCDISYKQLVT